MCIGWERGCVRFLGAIEIVFGENWGKNEGRGWRWLWDECGWAGLGVVSGWYWVGV